MSWSAFPEELRAQVLAFAFEDATVRYGSESPSINSKAIDSALCVYRRHGISPSRWQPLSALTVSKDFASIDTINFALLQNAKIVLNSRQDIDNLATYLDKFGKKGVYKTILISDRFTNETGYHLRALQQTIGRFKVVVNTDRRIYLSAKPSSNIATFCAGSNQAKPEEQCEQAPRTDQQGSESCKGPSKITSNTFWNDRLNDPAKDCKHIQAWLAEDYDKAAVNRTEAETTLLVTCQECRPQKPLQTFSLGRLLRQAISTSTELEMEIELELLQRTCPGCHTDEWHVLKAFFSTRTWSLRLTNEGHEIEIPQTMSRECFGKGLIDVAEGGERGRLERKEMVLVHTNSRGRGEAQFCYMYSCKEKELSEELEKLVI
ncbi:hypothetical protein LTS08_002931 [Lithohypha guttulata]|nr:hypothetical protein LTS08_002931 [Lithohypha guttulata]